MTHEAICGRVARQSTHMVSFCFRLIFGFLAMLFGTAMILCCFYNYFIERLPGFTGPTWFFSFGMGPVLVSTGIYWLRGLKKKGGS